MSLSNGSDGQGRDSNFKSHHALLKIFILLNSYLVWHVVISAPLYMSILTNLWKILKSFVTSIIVSYFQSIARGPTGVTVALHVVLDSNLEQLQRRLILEESHVMD